MNKIIKPTIVVLMIAALHLAACKLIVVLTLAMPSAAVSAGGLSKWATHVVVAVTRVLYFPIISLSLYSRQWFPGDLILLPMAANSLLWATGLYVLYRLLKRLHQHHRSTAKGF